jgi:hypothetical protein
LPDSAFRKIALAEDIKSRAARGWNLWSVLLNNRYDELKSGRVRPIDGEEAFARLKAKTEAQRNRMA